MELLVVDLVAKLSSAMPLIQETLKSLSKQASVICGYLVWFWIAVQLAGCTKQFKRVLLDI